MALSSQETADIEEAMAAFLARRRPPEEIRDQFDLGHRIEGQSVVIFEIRPQWNDKSRKLEQPFAKATYVRTVNRWRIFWRRADQNWHGYEPHPEAVFFEEFLAVVDEDEHGCFWG